MECQPQTKTKIIRALTYRVSNRIIIRCLVGQLLLRSHLPQGHKKLDFILKIQHLLKNLHILRIKIVNLDLTWRILIATKINLQEIKHVASLVYLMGTAENKFLNIVLKQCLLNLERKYRKTHKIYMLFLKQFSRRLTISWL